MKEFKEVTDNGIDTVCIRIKEYEEDFNADVDRFTEIKHGELMYKGLTFKELHINYEPIKACSVMYVLYSYAEKLDLTQASYTMRLLQLGMDMSKGYSLSSN